VLLLAGTRKGLFLLRGEVVRRHEQGAAARIQDGVEHLPPGHGATVQRSNDLGRTWKRAEQLALPEESGLTLEKAWHVEPGLESRPDTLYLGGTPGVLFRSDDGGATFEPVSGLLEHPTRERWQPGAGGMCCHSIQLDPSDPKRMYVGISAAGVFRTDDGGSTWKPANQGTAADFLPDPFPELGRCVHKLLLHPARPTASGSRTTAASTAATTAARAGNGWRATACPAASGSPSRCIRATRTRSG
jgi:hypothetical protein